MLMGALIGTPLEAQIVSDTVAVEGIEDTVSVEPAKIDPNEMGTSYFRQGEDDWNLIESVLRGTGRLSCSY